MDCPVDELDIKNEESVMEIFDPELWEEEAAFEQVVVSDPSVNESNDPDKGIQLMERDIEKLQNEAVQLRSRSTRSRAIVFSRFSEVLCAIKDRVVELRVSIIGVLFL
jgi:hypothetical protein